MAKKPGVHIPFSHAAARVLILLCLTLLTPNGASAATAVKAWRNTYADITAASQAPLAGRQLADGSVMFVVADGNGVTALRYDADGNRISAVPFYPAGTAREARIGPFGEIAVLSITVSCGGGCTGGNAWVMKYDGLTGRSLWSQPAVSGAGLLSGDTPHNLVLDEQGDVVVEVHHFADLTITKYDGVTGAPRFAPIALQAALIGSIAADAAGNVIVATTTIEDNLHHFETIVYDGQTGAVIWGPVFFNGGLDQDYARFVAVDATGVVVAGDGTEADGVGVTLIKYDAATGGTLWGPVRYVGPSSPFTGLTQLTLDASHDVILSAFTSPGGPDSESILLKYAGSSGSLVWGPAPIAATSSFFPPHVAVTGDGDIVTDGLEFNGSDYLPTTRRFRHDTGELAWGPETDASAWPSEVTVLTSDARAVILYPAFDSLSYPWPTTVTSRFAASGTIDWSVTHGETFATGPFRTVDVATTPDGKLAVAGQGATASGTDIIVFSYDQATGSTAWGPIVYGPNESASPVQIAADPAGDIVVLGSRFSGLQTIVLKYSRFGGFLLWGPTILDGTPARMAIDASGNVAVVSTVGGAGKDFSTALISGASGSPLWGPLSFDGGAGLDDTADAVTVSPTGNVFVAGRANAGTGARATLLSYSGVDGSVLWGPVVQPSISQPGMRLASDAAGNVFLAGGFFSMVTVKYDGASGTVAWGPVTIDGGSTPTEAHALAVDANGDVIVTGVVTSFDPTAYVTVKYAGGDGSVGWGPVTFHGPGSGADNALAIALDGAGNAVVSGTSRNDSALTEVTTLKYDGASGNLLWGPVSTPTGMDQTFGGLAVNGNMVFVGTSAAQGMITTAYTEALGIQTSPFDVPGARCGLAYAAAFEAANGEPPYSWTVVSGALPPGLDLSSAGAISGAPLQEGSFSFRVHVEDGAFSTAELDATILVTDASGIAPLVVSDGPDCGWTLSLPGSYASYQWLPGGQTTASIDVTPLEPTTYGLVAGDGNGCLVHAAVVVAGPRCTVTGPTLTSVAPRWGASEGGVPIALLGSNFDAGATFTIGGIPGGSVTVESPKRITGLTPPLEAGLLYDVQVVNSDALSSTLARAFLADFSDVPWDQMFHDEIAKITIAEITAGCGGGNYCPAMPVTRAQMAVLLLKALLGPGYTPPDASGTMFLDVHVGDFAADWIEDLATRGVTAGCGAGNYCPASPVTREQMAVLLLKTEHGSGYHPQPCGQVFADVVCPGPFTDWIEALYFEGITGGCASGQLLYCPASPVNRGQMAVFLVRTFSLP